LSIVLSQLNKADAEKLFSQRITVVGNGIADPCPGFETQVLPCRQARFAARLKLRSGAKLTAADLENTGGDPHIFKLLYLAHCTREKGLFDTLDAVGIANQALIRAGSALRIHLTVAGGFMNAQERIEFDQRLADPDLHWSGAGLEDPGEVPGAARPAGARLCVDYVGFVTGTEKRRVLTESDCFCFPTYYYAESFPVVLVEAMSFGISVITTRWRSIPELLPPDYPGFVEIRSPNRIAETLQAFLERGTGQELRQLFLRKFTLEHHLAGLARALHSAEEPTGNLRPHWTRSNGSPTAA
jgi:glycosyltransferase involved in cell wall biosynthesis